MNTSELKIDEAIDLLNEAARLKKEQFSRILSAKVENLKETVIEGIREQGVLTGTLGEIVEEGLHEAEEILREKAEELTREARENPWPYVAGAAAAALIFGFLIGRSRR